MIRVRHVGMCLPLWKASFITEKEAEMCRLLGMTCFPLTMSNPGEHLASNDLWKYWCRFLLRCWKNWKIIHKICRRESYFQSRCNVHGPWRSISEYPSHLFSPFSTVFGKLEKYARTRGIAAVSLLWHYWLHYEICSCVEYSLSYASVISSPGVAERTFLYNACNLRFCYSEMNEKKKNE